MTKEREDQMTRKECSGPQQKSAMMSPKEPSMTKEKDVQDSKSFASI